jgi:hypothetical protein
MKLASYFLVFTFAMTATIRAAQSRSEILFGKQAARAFSWPTFQAMSCA